MRRFFPSLYGNNETKLRLGGAILRGSLPHALLITGPRGSGRKTLAISIAAAICCQHQADDNYPLPCGACSNCRRIKEENFPDVKYLRRGGKATVGATELRDFREDMFLSPTEADCKFYVIEEAELMTTAAQNALLKVLEEPPTKVYIILISTGEDKMLSTIKSRAQSVQMQLFRTEELSAFLTSLSKEAAALRASDPERFSGIVLSSGGVIGAALGRLDEKSIQENESRRRCVIGLIEGMPKKVPFAKLYSAVSSLPQKRDELRAVLEDTLLALRDIIVTGRAEGTPTLFFTVSDEAELAGAGMNVKRLLGIYDIINGVLDDLDKNAVISGLLTDMAVRIKEA